MKEVYGIVRTTPAGRRQGRQRGRRELRLGERDLGLFEQEAAEPLDGRQFGVGREFASGARVTAGVLGTAPRRQWTVSVRMRLTPIAWSAWPSTRTR